MIENAREKYSVGALLYSPAVNTAIAAKILSGAFCAPYSLALCLEDTIAESMVMEAERQVLACLHALARERCRKDFYLPKIFIRVRRPEQIAGIYAKLGEGKKVLTGFILPKYSRQNAPAYNRAMEEVNEESPQPVYMMPILESSDIIDLRSRRETLCEIREKIDAVFPLVLNVRVGGNDFSNEFAVRRHCDETIYDIMPIANLLGDILTVFSRDYVVSGPVWEYFSGEWREGLRRELALDRLNGFIGKTVIHPKQISVVNEMLKVPRKDYEDARSILNWDHNALQVGKGAGGERMNEVRTHGRWAEKTWLLSQLYGVL